VTEWVKRADLLRVPGISTRYSNLLEAVGVTTVRDLRRRDPAKLHAALLEVNQRRQRPVVQRPPTEADVQGWVDGARRLSLVVKRW
jgi:predicted RecB family nuclease